MQHQIRERQTGEVFEENLTFAELKKIIEEYMRDDGEDWEPDFYEVVAIDDDGKVIGRWNGDGDFIDGTDAAGSNFVVY